MSTKNNSIEARSELTPIDILTLESALKVAAEQYRKASATSRASGLNAESAARLAETFDRQAAAAEALRERVENADRIILEEV